MFFSANKDKKLTLSNMHCSPERGIGVAFDNLDRFVETQSGKDTLHDMVGIAYEISEPIINQAESVVQEGNEASTSTKESRETSKTPTKKTSREQRSYDAKVLANEDTRPGIIDVQ